MENNASQNKTRSFETNILSGFKGLKGAKGKFGKLK